MNHSGRLFYRLIVAGFLVLATICLIYRSVSTWQKSENFYRRDDFNHYYATAWLLNEGTVPYGVPFAKTALRDRFDWHELVPSATNPPLLAALTSPLGNLEPKVAWILWELIVIVGVVTAYASALWVLRNKLSGVEQLLLLLSVFSGSPFFDLITHGQVQGFVLLLVVLGWISLRSDKLLCCALFWGISAALKLYTWPLIFFLLLLKFRYGVIAGLCAVACFLLPVAFWGPEMILSFFRFAVPIVQNSASQLWHNVSLGNAVLTILRDSGVPSSPATTLICLYLLPTLCVSLIAFVVFRSIQTESVVGKLEKRRSTDIALGLVSAVSFVCAPVAWNSYLIVLPFVATLVWANSSRSMALFCSLSLIWLVTHELPHPSSKFNLLGPGYGELFYYIHPWLTIAVFLLLSVVSLKELRRKEG